jgi:hypothetical protein
MRRAERRRLGVEPPCRGKRVIRRGRKRMLRGKTVLGRHDQTTAGQRQLPQRRVIAVAADHEAAAVQEQDRM